MDTTEELNGTYFYHGLDNVTAQELFWLIFLEAFAKHEGLAIEIAAMIILDTETEGVREVNMGYEHSF